MTVFVDASAMVAIMTREADWTDLAERLLHDDDRACSALSVWEVSSSLCHSYAFGITEAREAVALYIDAMKVRFVPLSEREYEVAMDAYARFGKGRHRAALNMGDCFAYACARTNRAKLLFKGDDFSRTDIETA